MKVNQIICGDCLGVMRDWPSESINCCISSPPYWALRDYGVDGQLGLEPTFEEYIDKLCIIYDEIKRVLRKDGTCWVNLGDTYNNAPPGSRDPERWPKQSRNDHTPKAQQSANVKVKSLCLIPQRFAIEMVNRGWILRNVIIWHKPNPMPSSAKDRFTVDFEYVYFFVKSKKYWFEPQYEPQYEPHISKPHGGQLGTPSDDPNVQCSFGDADKYYSPLGRNKRCVWTIPTQPYPESHFATFPEKLVEPMIKAGCPEFVCTKCGKAREKVFERQKPPEKLYTKCKQYDNMSMGSPVGSSKGCGQAVNNWLNEHPPTFKGYADCGCGAKFRPGIMLDPFCGSGTACQVAARLKRNYIGIDIKKEYVENFAIPRAKQGETGISVKEQKQGQGALFK